MRQDNSFIWVTFQRVGFHRYPQAAIDPLLKQVEYLGQVHRHKFFFKVAIEVFHNDRELEFHMVLSWIESLFENNIELDHKSCEMISDELAEAIGKKYPGRRVKIEVSEDSECGSFIEYSPVRDLP